MKKKFVLITLAIIAIMSFASCNSCEQATAYLIEEGKLVKVIGDHTIELEGGLIMTDIKFANDCEIRIGNYYYIYYIRSFVPNRVVNHIAFCSRQPQLELDDEE